MQRSIIQHGTSSLTVTLPNKWVSRWRLKKGDQVEVTEAGPQLLVTAGASHDVVAKEVSVKEEGVFTKNDLSHLYQLGYDEIIIHYDDAKTLEEIRSRLPNCIGYEILDQRKNAVTIKAIATTIEDEFDPLLRKSFLITKELAEGVHDALSRKAASELPELRMLESLNNKFTDVCLRILARRGYKIASRSMQAYDLIKNLERICDEYKRLCDYYKDGEAADKETLMALKDANAYYLLFYELFYAFDAGRKRRIFEERAALVQRFESVLRSSSGTKSLAFAALLRIVEKTYDATGASFALAL